MGKDSEQITFDTSVIVAKDLWQAGQVEKPYIVRQIHAW